MHSETEAKSEAREQQMLAKLEALKQQVLGAVEAKLEAHKHQVQGQFTSLSEEIHDSLVKSYSVNFIWLNLSNQGEATSNKVGWYDQGFI